MSIKTVTSSLPPASPSSPGLRYDADDEAPLPLGDTSNHTRHFTDSSKLSVLPTATVNINGWLTNQSSPAIKNRLRHRDVSLPEAATKPSVLSPPSVGVAAQRLTQSQLADALKEIERLRAYVRTLEASRADLKRDVAELRAKQEKDLADERVRGEKERVQDEQTGKADSDAKAEKAKRDKADVDVRRLRAEVTLLRGKCEEAEENAREEQRKRVAVEEELEKLALGV